MAESEYVEFPSYPFINGNLISGWKDFKELIDASDDPLLLLDGYSAIDWEEVFRECKASFSGYRLFNFNQCRISTDNLRELVSSIKPDGSGLYPFFPGKLIDFFDTKKIQDLHDQIEENISKGIHILCMGTGCSLLDYRRSTLCMLSISNKNTDLNVRNGNHALLGSPLIYGKISLRYIDEPVISTHIQKCFKSCHFYCDCESTKSPVFISGEQLRQDLHAYASRPFRVEPVFFETIWGGQFLKNRLNVGKELNNIGGSFEFAQKENDFYLTDGEQKIRIALDHFISLFPAEIMGNAVFQKCGAEFPFRLNLTDTVNGGNLSSQVHPDGRYTSENYGIYAHMDEKYFVIHAEKDAKVNLGYKDETDSSIFYEETLQSQLKNIPLALDKFQNSYPSFFGRVFLIPPGTVHNIREGNLIMEIITSHTIFTFRLYDYLRRDKDGNQRPLQIKEAFRILDTSLRSDEVKDTLIPELASVMQNSNRILTAPLRGESFTVIQHLTLKEPFHDSTCHKCFLLYTLVRGKKAVISWHGGSHELHYLETILIPGSVGEYSIEPDSLDQCDLLCVTVSHEKIHRKTS